MRASEHDARLEGDVVELVLGDEEKDLLCRIVEQRRNQLQKRGFVCAGAAEKATGL